MINSTKKLKNQIDQIKNYIGRKHNIIYKGNFVKDINNNNDIYVIFKRLKKYAFTNGSVRQYLESQKYDCILALGYNHNKRRRALKPIPIPQSPIIIIFLNYFSIIHFINYSEFKF